MNLASRSRAVPGTTGNTPLPQNLVDTGGATSRQDRRRCRDCRPAGGPGAVPEALRGMTLSIADLVHAVGDERRRAEAGSRRPGVDR